MKTAVTIVYETNSVKESDDILTQIGLLMVKNKDKLKQYEVNFNLND